MEKISKLLGFLIILKESIKILPKNGKFMAPIALLSLLIPSILVCLFSYLYQSMIAHMTTNPSVPFFVFAVEIVLLLIFLATSHLLRIATILVTATSYTGTNLTVEALFSSIKKTWRRTFSYRGRASKGSHYLMVAAFNLAILLAIVYTNFITIGIAIIGGISVFVVLLYSSVAGVLSVVVAVLEERKERTEEEAIERAEDLVKEGQHLHGFMFNLFVNLVAVIVLAVGWILLRDTGSSSLATYALLFLDSMALLNMLITVGYTVFYFQCKEHHGEEIDMNGVGGLQYTKLPTTTTTLLNDIP